MSSLTVEEDQRWLPTHVQVTVLRGRGLRGKGKHGTSDVYTIIQLGKEKYSTGLAEKTTEPEWREECSFELQPGALEGGEPPAELVLTVMHRALIGLDVFLGQAAVRLDQLFHDRRHVRNQWYRLNSKTGKKEKERGNIQVTILFTRNNLTASMHDLVMKDKGASTFSKLKERMKGKRRSSEEESSSAIEPGGYSSLDRMRQRMPSDGGGEEDYEDDEGGEVRRSKMRTFFLRGKLRKSSDTRSSTSLGSESSESSSRGGSLSPTAGISVVVSDLSNSPSNSSNFTADNSPEHTANPSPKSSSLKCEFGDEAGEITIAVPPPTVCVNGSHAYQTQAQDRGSGKSSGSLGLGLLQKAMPHSVSLQNLSTRPFMDLPKGPVGDGRRWSFDRAGEEEKAAIAAALEKSGPMLGEGEERPEQASLPKASRAESENQVKKQRKNLFSHGRSESAGKGQSRSKDESEETSAAAAEEKHRAWFGSKDSHNKPSLVVSTQFELSTDPHPPPLPLSHHPSCAPVDSTVLVSTLLHTNPFSHCQITPPPISQCNPFFPLLQHNPFFPDMLTNQSLKSSLPPLPYRSSSLPPITDLFPQSSNPNLTQDNPTVEDTVFGDGTKDQLKKRPLPPVPVEKTATLIQPPSNPFLSAEAYELDSHWEDTFDAFAAFRLQSPEDLSMERTTQQDTPGDQPLEHDGNKVELQPAPDADEQNVNNALHDRPGDRFLSHDFSAPGQMKNNHTPYIETFPPFLETIPEQISFDSDDSNVSTPTNPPKLFPFDATKQDTTTNNDFTNTNINTAPFHHSSSQLSSNNNNISPDPSSSGLGSSTEEDSLSYFSSQSEKFSVSSSEEAESTIKNFSDSSVTKNVKESESRKLDHPFLADDSHQKEDSWVKTVDLSFLEDSVQRPPLQREESLGGENPNLKTSANPVLMSTLQPTCRGSQQPNSDGKKESKESSLDSYEGFGATSKSNAIDGAIFGSPFDEFYPSLPSVHFTTSSPEVRKDLLDLSNEKTSSEEQETPPHSHVDLGIFDDSLNVGRIASSPGQDFDTTHQSSNSFLHSRFSADSQDYLTCYSQSFSKGSSISDLNETLFSANSTLCDEMSDFQSFLGDHLGTDHTNPSQPFEIDVRGFEINHDEMFGDSFRWEEGNGVNLENNLIRGDGLQVLAAPLADKSSNPKILSEEREGNQDDILKSPKGQHVTLQRSYSEGAITPAFDPLLSSFGSDPCAIQESSSVQPGPDLFSPNPFAPSLTPESSSLHVALSALSPSATVSATVPPSSEPDVSEQRQEAGHRSSPHPVKPLTTAKLAEEKRSVLATGLEKLKSTIHPGRSSQIEQEADRKKSLTEGAGSYYHLTHNELVALLLEREVELERQKAEFERQKLLLAKREVELKRLKPQVRDLEDYIDTLLVQIMEQTPTLLQVRTKLK